MVVDHKPTPLDESSSRQIWVGWGSGIVCLALAFLVGGIFAPYLLLFAGATVALRGHYPNLFAKHVEAQIIAGIPYRRQESFKAWAIAVSICAALAGVSSLIHQRIAPANPDIAKTIIAGVGNLFEQRKNEAIPVRSPIPQPAPQPADQAPILQPQPPSVSDRRIQFTSSDLWTDTRKAIVREQIHKIDRYLDNYSGIITLPTILPLISIVEGTQAATGFITPPDSPFDGRHIPLATKRLIPWATRESYANYVFDVLLGVYEAPEHISPLEQESWIYASYFADSSLNKAPSGNLKSLNGWLSALWDIRTKRGRDLTDRALLYGIRAPVADNRDLNTHFRERLTEGVLVVRDVPEMLEVNKILDQHDLLH